MTWVLIIVVVWALLGVLAAVLIGRSIAHAERKDARQKADRAPNFVVDGPYRFPEIRPSAAAPPSRPRLPPVPPVASRNPEPARPSPTATDDDSMLVDGPQTIPGHPAARPSVHDAPGGLPPAQRRSHPRRSDSA
jgi:hypothetical protein